MKWKFWLRLACFLAGLALTTTVLAQVSTHFDLGWRLLSGGGGPRSSTHYQVDDVLGQWAAGMASGPNYQVEPGFIFGAVQVLPCYPLTLVHSGSGSDPVASPGRSSQCAISGQYVAGESINLSASPAAGWVVSVWSGTANDASSAATNSLTMPAAAQVVRVIYVGQPDGYEADNMCAQSHLIDVNGSVQEHTFHLAGDADWVRFDATNALQYRVEVQTPIASTADVNLSLYPGCDLGATQTFEAAFTPGVRLDFTAVASGPIYLQLTNFNPAIAGPDVSYRVTVQEIRPNAQKGAVILLAGRYRVNDHLQPNIQHVISIAYNLFKQQGYSDDQIMYLAIDPALPGADQGATVANLRDAITVWAVNKVGADRPLTLYLMDHGNADQLYVDEVAQQHINPSDLDTWLNQLEAAVPNLKVTVIIEACYSGSFIEGIQSISNAGRVVISSTTASNVAFASADGARFSDQFLTGLSQDIGICLSFKNARESVLQLSSIQNPWMDANGNKLPNETVDCETANLQVPVAGLLTGDRWAPYIVMAQAPASITNHRGTVSAQVRDNKTVARVWAVVYPPSYIPPTNNQELVPENQPTFELVSQGSEMFSTEYTHFDEMGRYRIAIYAEDDSGLRTGPYMLELQLGKLIFIPRVSR